MAVIEFTVPRRDSRRLTRSYFANDSQTELYYFVFFNLKDLQSSDVVLEGKQFYIDLGVFMTIFTTSCFKDFLPILQILSFVTRSDLKRVSIKGR